MRKDNRGLTLIELIVTVAIGMIFSGVILTFIAGAAKSYRRTSGGAQSQIEMQDALDQLDNLTISTNLSLYYVKGINKNTVSGEKVENDSDIDTPLEQSKTLFFGTLDEDGIKSYYSVIWNAEKKVLYYFPQSIGQQSGTGTGGTGTGGTGTGGTGTGGTGTGGTGTGTGGTSGSSSIGTEQALAENVTQFAVNIHHAADQHIVRFKIVTEVNGREIEKTETVTLRNDVVIAAPGTE